MPRQITNTFTITIKKTNTQSYIIEANGPNGIRVQPQPFRLLLLPEQQTILNNLTHEDARVSSDSIQEIGLSLYKSIFTDQVLLAFGQAQGRVGAKGLRVRLNIAPPELAVLPWEAMYNGQEWLTAKSDTPLVRILPQNHQAKTLQKLQIRGPLKVLFVGASPTDLPNLDIEETAHQLQLLLKEDIDKKHIIFDILINTTLDQLRQKLVKEYHILYFAGHGSPEGIFLDDGQGDDVTDSETASRLPGDPYLVSAQTLAQVLEGKPTRLVFLAACNTGNLAGGESALLSNFTQELASQAQLPGLVAMQYAISNDQANQLTSQFFAALAAFQPVDAALAEARKALIRQEQVGRDVIAPVMYLQAKDGALFQKARNWAAIGATVFAIIAVMAFIVQFLFFQPDRQQITNAQQTAQAEATRRAQAEVAKDIAEQESVTSQSRQLATQAMEQLDNNDYELGLLLAIEAGYIQDTFETDTALRKALARSGRPLKIFSGHTDDIVKLDWDDSGERFVTASLDGTSRVWSPLTSECIAVLDSHSDIVWSAEWYGNKIVTASRDGSARIWNLGPSWEATEEYPKEELILIGHTDSVNSATWSRDGKQILTASRDGTARIWDAETGQPLMVFSAPKSIDGINDAQWNSNEKFILTRNHERYVRVWDVTTGLEVANLEHTYGIWAAEWNHDGTQIATGAFNRNNDYVVTIWNAVTGEELTALYGHTNEIRHINWSKDDKRIVTASLDGTARIWNVDAGSLLNTLDGHQGCGVYHAIWSFDDVYVVTAGCTGTPTNGTLHLWDSSSGKDLGALLGHELPVFYVAWKEYPRTQGKGPRIASVDFGGVARTWDIESHSEAAALLHDGVSTVFDVSWHPDGILVATAGDDGLGRVWNSTTGEELLRLSGHTGKYFEDSVRSITWNKVGTRLLTSGDDGTARVWDANTGEQIAIYHGSEGRLSYTAWNQDETKILGIEYLDGVIVWDVKTGNELFRIPGINKATWSPDGTYIATIGDDYIADLWDTKTGTVYQELLGHTDKINSVSWNKAMSQIVTASDDGTVRVWDANTGEQIAISTVHTDKVTHAVWNKNGTKIATASNDKTVRIWNLQENSQAVLLRFEELYISNLTWSQDGVHLLVNRQIWDTEAGNVAATVTDEFFPGLVWNPQETRLLSTNNSYDGYALVNVYSANVEELLKEACKRVIRNMTQEEWKQFMENEPYRKTCPEM